MSVACSVLWSLQSHVGGERWRAAPGGERRDNARRQAATSGRQRKAPLRREMAGDAGGCLRVRPRKAPPGVERRDSARRRAARGGQRKAPSCESGIYSASCFCSSH
eukprot:5693072-Pleurochrysis_carterae.AAC.1